MAPSTAVRHQWALIHTRRQSEQAGLTQVAMPRAWHRTVGWPLGVPWVSKNRNVSLLQSDAQTENVQEEVIKNGVWPRTYTNPPTQEAALEGPNLIVGS